MKPRSRRGWAEGRAGRLTIGGVTLPVRRWTATLIDPDPVELVDDRGGPMTQANPNPQQPGDPVLARAMQKDELIRALEAAVTEVEEADQGPPLGRSASPATAVAMPGWLQTILKSAIAMVGPMLIEAIRQWLNTLKPQPASQSGPQVAPPA